MIVPMSKIDLMECLHKKKKKSVQTDNISKLQYEKLMNYAKLISWM